MSALVNGQVECLYAALLEHGKAVQPEKLGVIGRARLKARMEADCDMSTFRHDCVADIDDDGRPFVVEMAMAESDEARVIRGVNWSAMIGDPFPMLDESQHYIYGDTGVTLFVHYVKPGAASMDCGKTRVSVSEKVDGVMNDMLAKLAERWVRKQHAVIRVRQAEYSAAERDEKQERIEAKREEKRSLKELLFEVIPVERDKYYEKIGSEIDNRQFYYNCRNAVKSIDPSKDFSQQTFDQIRKQWEEENGPIEGLCKKARGVFVEPHTGRRLPLGTRDVRDYIIPDYEYDKIVVWEKQGFEPLVAKHQLAQKYDMGMIFNEGLSVDACRAFARECHDKGIKVFVLHDCDPAGYVIFDAMRREVECVDISWTVDECLAAGKVPESDYRRCAKKKEEDEANCTACRSASFHIYHRRRWNCFSVKKFTTTASRNASGTRRIFGNTGVSSLTTCSPIRTGQWPRSRSVWRHTVPPSAGPPRAVLKHKAIEKHDSQLRDAASWAIHNALNIDSMINDVVKRQEAAAHSKRASRVGKVGQETARRVVVGQGQQHCASVDRQDRRQDFRVGRSGH